MKNELTRKNGYSDYDFFNEAMHDFFPSFYGFGRNNGQKYMRTDIKEAEKEYVMEVELPGLDKKDIHIDLKDGYLNISVKKEEKQEEGKKENYIHRERSFSCSRKTPRRRFWVKDSLSLSKRESWMLPPPMSSTTVPFSMIFSNPSPRAAMDL